jgi:hypothetical protein
MQNVHVRVNDADTGRPTPVRIRFTDAAASYYAPLGRLAKFRTGPNEDVGGNVLVGGRAYAYIDGTCEIPLEEPGHDSVYVSRATMVARSRGRANRASTKRKAGNLKLVDVSSWMPNAALTILFHPESLFGHKLADMPENHAGHRLGLQESATVVRGDRERELKILPIA